MSISRSDQYLITLSINKTAYGVWDKLTGGDKDSDDTKYHPGGMVEPVSLGGRSTVDNVTLSKLYDEALHDRIGTILDRVGKADCVVVKQPLDEDRNPYGDPLVYTGRLKRCGPPEADSEATNTASLLEVEISSATVNQQNAG